MYYISVGTRVLKYMPFFLFFKLFISDNWDDNNYVNRRKILFTWSIGSRTKYVQSSIFILFFHSRYNKNNNN